MPRRPSPLPVPLDSVPFVVAEGLAAGASARRLRAGDLESSFHGVRAPVGTSAARAYAARMPPHERFTHTTAAVLLGLRMPQAFAERELHVGAAAPHRAPRTAGVSGHRVPEAAPTTLVDGLRVSPPVETWIQCAALLGVDDLIVMGDGLVSRHGARATLAELERAVRAHKGNRGAARLALTLPQIRAGTDSAMETVLRLVIVRAGFPEPEVNGKIRNEYGAVIAHGDLVYRREKVLLEYEGGGHWEPRQFVRDIQRLDDLMEDGWRVIRVDKSLLARRATLFAKLRKALAASAQG